MSLWTTLLNSGRRLFDSGPEPEIDSAGADGCAPDPNDVGFTAAVVGLGAKMAAADGLVSDQEIMTFARVFRAPPEEAENVRRVFTLARQTVRGYEAYARQVAGLFPKGAPALEELLDCLFHIAESNGEVTASETEYLAEVARIFGIDTRDFEALREAQRGPDEADPWRVLGIARDADEDTARKAWRELVRTHHPDVLTGQGMPPEFVALANERLSVINAAWDKVRKGKGWK